MNRMSVSTLQQLLYWKVCPWWCSVGHLTQSFSQSAVVLLEEIQTSNRLFIYLHKNKALTASWWESPIACPQVTGWFHQGMVPYQGFSADLCGWYFGHLSVAIIKSNMWGIQAQWQVNPCTASLSVTMATLHIDPLSRQMTEETGIHRSMSPLLRTSSEVDFLCRHLFGTQLLHIHVLCPFWEACPYVLPIPPCSQFSNLFLSKSLPSSPTH